MYINIYCMHMCMYTNFYGPEAILNPAVHAGSERRGSAKTVSLL